MKLYYSKGACSLAVRITLHEAEVEFNEESVDLKLKKTESGEDFYTVNLKGCVPVLELNDGILLTENIAIHVYLSDFFGLDELLPPASDFKRYHVLEWFNYISMDIHKPCSPFFNPNVSDEVFMKCFRPIVIKNLNYIDLFLKKNIFLGGETVCIADHYFFVVLRWMRALKIDLGEFNKLNHYFNRMSIRPCVVQSLEDEG